jgi:adenosine deaminase
VVSPHSSAAVLPQGEPQLREKLLRLPKAELHLHLDGSLRPETLLELSDEAGESLPHADPEELRSYMEAPAGGSLVDYLERFRITLAALQTREGLERVAFELLEDLASENVRYAEIRYSPVLHTGRGLQPADTVEAVLRGIRRGEQDSTIRANLIVCAIRDMSPATSEMLAELAVAWRGRGVVAFDLAGPELGHPPGEHRSAFRIARLGHLGVTIHAGEAAGPESIREAVHVCGAQRIGHGTRLDGDRSLLEYMRDFRIPLEICLLSNVQTGAVPDIGGHPLRKYFNVDVPLSLNTDNRLISGTTVTGEYWRAHRELGFSWEELMTIARMSFETAFLPWPEKRALVAEIEREIEKLDGTGDQPVT